MHKCFVSNMLRQILLVLCVSSAFVQKDGIQNKEKEKKKNKYVYARVHSRLIKILVRVIVS